MSWFGCVYAAHRSVARRGHPTAEHEDHPLLPPEMLCLNRATTNDTDARRGALHYSASPGALSTHPPNFRTCLQWLPLPLLEEPKNILPVSHTKEVDKLSGSHAALFSLLWTYC